MNKVLRVSTFSVLYAQVVVFELHPFVVIPKMVGVIAVCQQLAIVSVESVATLIFGIAGRADVAQSPFAESGCFVACIFHYFEDCTGIGGKRELPFRIEFEVTADRRMSAVRTCQQAGAGRGADGCPRITLRKTHSVLCQTVDVGCLELFLSVTTQVTITQIVRKDKNDIRFFVLILLRMDERSCQQEAGRN